MVISIEKFSHNCETFTQNLLTVSNKENMRVVVLVSHGVRVAILLELLELHRCQITEQIIGLRASLQSRPVAFNKDATPRSLLHRFEARAFGPNNHSDKIDCVILRNLDSLFQQL